MNYVTYDCFGEFIQKIVSYFGYWIAGLCGVISFMIVELIHCKVCIRKFEKLIKKGVNDERTKL